MALTTSYLMTVKNVESFFNSLITAKAPETFTQKFLESLEFKSTNDRLCIGLLKGLGFLDENSTPTERYFKFLDQTRSKEVLAEAIKEAYGDLFAVNIKANDLSVAEVKNKLKTLTQGKNSDKVVGLMANTFKALVDYAVWNSEISKKPVDGQKMKEVKKEEIKKDIDIAKNKNIEVIREEENKQGKVEKMQLHYNIQIHLPDTRDQAVYDAIFKALNEHLF